MILKIFRKLLRILIYNNPIDIILGRIIYGNNASFISNFRGRYLLNLNRQGIKVLLPEVLQLDSEGWLKINDCNDLKLIQSIKSRFEEKINKVKFDNSGRFDFSSINNPVFFKNFPETLRLLNNKIEEYLRNYYQNKFTITNVHIYRILKTNNKLKTNHKLYGATASWHNDGSNVDTLKVFIPLDTIGVNDGPMEFISKSITKKIIRNNILNFSQKKISQEIVDKYNFQKMLFQKTDAYIINTNECMHRATSPNSDFRDLLVYYCASSKDNFISDWHLKATNNIYGYL